MNSKSPHISQDHLLGKRIATYLNLGNQQLSYEITERLRASRTRAIASRRATQFELKNADDVQIQPNGSLRMPYPSKARDIYSLIVFVYSFIENTAWSKHIYSLIEFFTA